MFFPKLFLDRVLNFCVPKSPLSMEHRFCGNVLRNILTNQSPRIFRLIKEISWLIVLYIIDWLFVLISVSRKYGRILTLVSCICIYRHFLSMVNWINYAFTISYIRNQLILYPNFDVVWVNRNANRVTHILARAVRQFENPHCWDKPPDIVDGLLDTCHCST